MKIHLIDCRTGVVKAIVLKEWMRIGLSICLLGLPVILGYFSIQLAEARNAEYAKNSQTPTLGDTFEFSGHTPDLRSSSVNDGFSNASLHSGLLQSNDAADKSGAIRAAVYPSAQFYRAFPPRFAAAGSVVPQQPFTPDNSLHAAAFIGSRNFQQALNLLIEPAFPAVLAPTAATQSAGHRHGWNLQAQPGLSRQESGTDSPLTLFAKYGDVLKKGRIITLATAIAYAPQAFIAFALHKNGRVIDPATYIHATVR